MPLILLVLILLFLSPVGAQPYQTPDPVLAQIVDQPRLPSASVSPDYRWICMFRREGHQTIADLCGPELKLAGVRFNPEKYGPSRQLGSDKFTMRDRQSGESWPVEGLSGGRILSRSWSPDSSVLVLVVEESDGVRLWSVPAGGRTASRLCESRINLVLAPSLTWYHDGRSLLTALVVEGEAPPKDSVPEGPAIQETSGSKAPVRTYQDLLKDSQDADLFAHYATSQLVRISLDGGKVTPLGKPALNDSFSVSPDDKYILLRVVDRPFSYLVPASRFGGRSLILNNDGTLLKTIEQHGPSEELPKGFDSVRTGRRSVQWRSDAPATLVWTEATDQGDMKTQTPVHDRVFTWQAPFQEEPQKLLELEMRYSGIDWGHKNLALVSEWRFSDRKVRTWKFNPASPEEPWVSLEDRSYNDQYKDPGSPLHVMGEYRTSVLATPDGETLVLRGSGASPEGKIPFLALWNSKTGKSRRVWQSEEPYYERVLSMLDDEGKTFLTLRETVDTPPNFFERTLDSGELAALTDEPHPTPEFKDIKKEIVYYKRADGVELSGTLYLPADYKGGPLPVLMWAYPQEFKDADVAGQKTDSPYEFNRVSYWGPLPFLAQGIAVFDDPKMPIVGEGDKLPNDAFREQLVANAQAAIDALVEKGVCDPKRVAIGGHSYGAFMVANLLAHSDLFKTGIARSGAYNRSLTPFGFQGEERDFWEGQSVYADMSPFFHADKINEPILMIHGDEDNNSGTYPMQSERMFAALKGLGGRARLVMLPKESHGYRARESLLHMLWEEQEWLKRHLLNPG